MPRRKLPQKTSSEVVTHLSELLDQALEQTFPASDPVAINVEITALLETDEGHLRVPNKKADRRS